MWMNNMDCISVRECHHETITADWFDSSLLRSDHKNYFTIEVDAESHRFAIQTNSYVGIVPLSSDYGIRILPKSGLKNLTYMLHRSGLLNRSLETPFDENVPYEVPEDDLESFFEGLVRSFLKAVDRIKTFGLMRESVTREQDSYMVRGKIDYHRWARAFPHTGGIPIPQRVFNAEIDNLYNRVLKYCLEYLASFATMSALVGINRDEVLGRLDYFGHVPSSHISGDDLSSIEHDLESGRILASRYYYIPALNLALLILRGSGLALGDIEKVSYSPILINTNDMFEKYIRVICQEATREFDAHADDGKQHPISFYQESSEPIRVKPDILIRRGGSTLMTIDVKYKFKPTEQDHYQIWAYLHAHQVKRGGFVSVAEKEPESNATRWFKREQYAIFDRAFDCRKVIESEGMLKELISDQVKLVLA